MRDRTKGMAEKWAKVRGMIPGQAVVGYKVSAMLCGAPEDVDREGELLRLGSRKSARVWKTPEAARRWIEKHRPGQGFFIRSVNLWRYFRTQEEADAYEKASLPEVDETPTAP